MWLIENNIPTDKTTIIKTNSTHILWGRGANQFMTQSSYLTILIPKKLDWSVIGCRGRGLGDLRYDGRFKLLLWWMWCVDVCEMIRRWIANQVFISNTNSTTMLTIQDLQLTTGDPTPPRNAGTDDRRWRCGGCCWWVSVGGTGANAWCMWWRPEVEEGYIVVWLTKGCVAHRQKWIIWQVWGGHQTK